MPRLSNSLVPLMCQDLTQTTDCPYPALKERCNTLTGFAQGFKEVMNPPICYDEKMRSKLDSNTISTLDALFSATPSIIWEQTQEMESYLHT